LLYDSHPQFIRIYQIIQKELKNEKINFINTLDEIFETLEKEQRTIIVTSYQSAKFLEEIKLFNYHSLISCIIFDSSKNILNENWMNIHDGKIISIEENGSKNLVDNLKELLKSSLINDFIQNVKIKAAQHFNTNEACISSMFYHNIFELFDKEKLSIEQSKEDFISYCKEHKSSFDLFPGHHLKMIEQEILEDKFRGDNLINWYTRESYFHCLINNTIREEKMLNLFKIRYFIQEMKNALLEHKVTERNRPEKLYRASKIHKDELKLFDVSNVGDKKIIKLLGFISTSQNKEILSALAEPQFNNKNDNEISIVYRLEIDDKHDSQMFDIKEVSSVRLEDEILLNHDIYIKINSIEESKDKYIDYYINCSFSDFDEIKSTINPMTLQIKNDFSFSTSNHKIDNFYLADLFLLLTNFKELEILLDRTEYNDDSVINYKLYYFGTMYTTQGKNSEAIECFETLLSLSESKFLNESYRQMETIRVYNYMIAVNYLILGNFSEFSKYIINCSKGNFHAEKFINECLNSNGDIINISLFNELAKDFNKSQGGEQQNMLMDYLLNFINGEHNFEQKKFAEALEFYEKSLKIVEKSVNNQLKDVLIERIKMIKNML